MTYKILITGSCGFIPANFIRKCFYQKLDFNIVGIDKIVHPNNLRNMYINKANKTYFADILDSHILDLIFNIEKPDIVIHAAESHDNYDCGDVNIGGTENIISACTKYEVKKLIYLSTTEVYGDKRCYEYESCCESVNCVPYTNYAKSKFTGENEIKNFFKNQYFILRCSNNFGPRQKSVGFIPTIIFNIINDKEFILGNFGKITYDWTYVDDTVQCLIDFIQKDRDNGIYNISSNSEFTELEVVHEICEFFNKGHNLIKYAETFGSIKLTPNTEKIRSLGWKPEFKFKDMIPQVCEWYQNNQWFYKS